jgi:hypothetical protein
MGVHREASHARDEPGHDEQSESFSIIGKSLNAFPVRLFRMRPAFADKLRV